MISGLPNPISASSLLKSAGITRRQLKKLDAIAQAREYSNTHRIPKAYSARPFVLCGIPVRRPAKHSLEYFHGRHTLQWGAEIRYNRDASVWGENPNGVYTFGGGTAYSPVAITSTSGLHNTQPGAQPVGRLSPGQPDNAARRRLHHNHSAQSVSEQFPDRKHPFPVFGFCHRRARCCGWRNKGELGVLQIRAEFFNVFNLVSFGIPSNTLLGSGFGLVSKTAGTSRQIQFSLRLIF